MSNVAVFALSCRPTWWRGGTLLACLTFIVFSPYWKVPFLAGLYDALAAPNLVVG